MAWPIHSWTRRMSALAIIRGHRYRADLSRLGRRQLTGVVARPHPNRLAGEVDVPPLIYRAFAVDGASSRGLRTVLTGSELLSSGHGSGNVSFMVVSQKQRDRGLAPNVGPKRLLGTARSPGVAWPSVDGLEHGWPGSVGVVGAECHLFAGFVLGALHVEFHADSPVGVAAENHPVTGFV
jgi:hypothetical protein